jgi:hypothetical protein
MASYIDLCGNEVFYNGSLKFGDETYQQLVGGSFTPETGISISGESVLLFQKTNNMTPSFDTSGITLSDLSNATISLIYNEPVINPDMKLSLRINTVRKNDNNDINEQVRSSYMIRSTQSFVSGGQILLSMSSLSEFQSNYEDIVNEGREQNNTKSNSLLEYVENGHFLQNEILNIELVVENGIITLQNAELNIPLSMKPLRKINYKYKQSELNVFETLFLSVHDENRVVATDALYKEFYHVPGENNLVDLSNGNILSILENLTIHELEDNLSKIGLVLDESVRTNIIALQLDSLLWGWIDESSNPDALQPNDTTVYTLQELSESYSPKELTNSNVGENNVSGYMSRQFVVSSKVFSVQALFETMGATALEMRGGKAWYEDNQPLDAPVYKMNGTELEEQQLKIMKKNYYPFFSRDISNNPFDVYSVYAIGEIASGSTSDDNDYLVSDFVDVSGNELFYGGDEIKYNVNNFDLSNNKIRSVYNTIVGVRKLSLQTTNPMVEHMLSITNRVSVLASIVNKLVGTTSYIPVELKDLGYAVSNVVNNTELSAKFSLQQLKDADYTIQQVIQSSSLDPTNERSVSDFGNKVGSATIYNRNDWTVYADATDYILNNLNFDSTFGLVENLASSHFTLQQLYDSGFLRSTDINSLRMLDILGSTDNYTADKMLAVGYLPRHMALVDGLTSPQTGKLTSKNSTLHRNFNPVDEVLYEANEILVNNVEASTLLNWHDDVSERKLIYALQDLNGFYSNNPEVFTNYSVDKILVSLNFEVQPLYITQQQLEEGKYTLLQIKQSISLLSPQISLVDLLDNSKYNFEDAVVVNPDSVADFETFDKATYNNVIDNLLTTLILAYELVLNDVNEILQGMGFTENEILDAFDTNSIEQLYENYKENNNLDTLFAFRSNELLSTYPKTQLYADGLSAKFLNFTIITKETTHTFVVEDFEQTLDLEKVLTLDVSEVTSIVADSTVEVDCDIVHFLSTFKFNTDSIDMDDLPENDIEYFTFEENWVHNEASGNYVFENPMEKEVKEEFFVAQETMSKNMLRHIANKKFNTYHAVDLFKNESELLEEIVNVGITKLLRGLKTQVQNTKHTKVTGSTEADNECGISKTLLKQILFVDPTRVSDQIAQFKVDNNGINENSIISIPVVHGDKVTFKVIVRSINTDANGDQIERSYKIVLRLVDSRQE